MNSVKKKKINAFPRYTRYKNQETGECEVALEGENSRLDDVEAFMQLLLRDS